MLLARAVGVILLTSFFCTAITIGAEPTRRELLAAIEGQIKDVTTSAGPAIATIVVSRSDNYPSPDQAEKAGKLGGFDPKEFLKADPSPERAALAKALDLSDIKEIPNHGYAGGVVIDSQGYVLTPYHVVDGAKKVYVFLPGGSGSYADIHAADARADIAILKLQSPPEKLSAIKFVATQMMGDADRKPNVFSGKLCVHMSNPYSSTFGLDRPSAVFGSITNLRYKPARKNELTAGRRYTEYGSLLEYDLKFGAGNPGGLNSGMTGGVLLNLDGELIGLTNSAAVAWGNEVGPGYAVPTDTNFRRISDVLSRGEEVEYGFLGVRPADLREDFNLDARSVVPISGGPAANAGIIRGDVITRIDGIPVESFEDLLLNVGSALAGSKITVSLIRNRRPMDVTVTLAKLKHDLPFIASQRPQPVFGLSVDYGSLLAQQDFIPAGVSIREIVPNSPAEKQLNALGEPPTKWVVTRVNGNAISSPAEFYKAARNLDKVKLTLIDPKAPTTPPQEITLP